MQSPKKEKLTGLHNRKPIINPKRAIKRPYWGKSGLAKLPAFNSVSPRHYSKTKMEQIGVFDSVPQNLYTLRLPKIKPRQPTILLNNEPIDKPT